MASQRAQLGVQLWRLYASQGRVLPAAWVARAVGVSPTTMGKYLAEEGYRPVRGYTPGQGWNLTRRQVRRVMDKMISNGHVIEMGPPVELTEEEQAECGMDFLTAIDMACGGMAVARMEDCSRVVFREDITKPLQVGAFDDDTGVCTSEGRYEPTVEDFQATDWVLMAAETLNQ